MLWGRLREFCLLHWSCALVIAVRAWWRSTWRTVIAIPVWISDASKRHGMAQLDICRDSCRPPTSEMATIPGVQTPSLGRNFVVTDGWTRKCRGLRTKMCGRGRLTRLYPTSIRGRGKAFALPDDVCLS